MHLWRPPGEGVDHSINAGPIHTGFETFYWQTKNLPMDVQIRVSLKDVFGNEQWQIFTRHLVCGLDRETAVSPASDDIHDWDKKYKTDGNNRDEP